MVPLKPVLIAISLVCLPFCVKTASAEGWFFLNPLELEAEIRFDGYQTNLERSSGDLADVAEKRQSLLLEERLFVGLSGYIIDPRISNFKVQVTPVFRQGWESVNGEDDRTRGNDLDYNINLGFLQGSQSRFDANLNTFRITSANDIAFGSRNNSDISAHELLVNWKNDWFPLLFGVKTGSYMQEFIRLDGLRSRRDEDRDRVRLTGRSSKLQLTLDHERVDEKVFDRDYTISRGLLNHKFNWGRNSGLFSDIRAFDRQGFNTYRQLNWNERLRISHTENLVSNTSYHYFSQQAQTDSTTHEGIFRLEHSLYNNLTTSARLRGRSENSDVLDRQQYEVGGNATYRKAFDFGAVTASLYGDYRYTDRISEAGTAEVINEEHEAGFIEPIIFEQQLIHQSTIQVTAEDGFVYTGGFDYEVIPFGGAFTQIRILPAGRIRDGDLLLVNYLYELLPSAEYTSSSAGYSFSYAYRWIRLFHNSYRFDHRLSSGYGLPPDQENRTTGLELSWNFPRVIARFRAETRFRRHGGFESRDIVMNQTLGIPLSNTFSINISGNQVFTDSEGVVTLDPLMDKELQFNESSAEYYALDASLTWFARPNLTLTPSVGVWSRQEQTRTQVSRDVDRMYYTAEIRVSWLLRKLTMDFYINHNASDIDGTDRTGNRVFFSVRRQFR